jgi:MerR family transcriptional regulator, redox-sensitive transcriptional activator SoxR
MNDLMSIGEVVHRTGVPASTLRYYDRIGLVRAAGRSGGQRRYDQRAVRRLRAVALCQRSGFTLEEIRALLDGGRPWQTLARRKLSELDARIADLHQALGLLRTALECGCRDLATCDRAGHLATVGVEGDPALASPRAEGGRLPATRHPAAGTRV